MRRVALFACISLLPLAVLGCSSGDESSPGGTSSVGQPIYKGTNDTTTDAAMALAIDLGNGQGAGCSGAVIAVKGNSGYFLTAAHCAVQPDSQGNPTKTPLKPSQLFVLAGTNYQSPSATYTVVETKVHPSFSPTNLLYDFAMVRFTFNGAAPAVVPAMTTAEDTLAAGTKLDVIGYGQTDTDAQNSIRKHATMTISGFQSNGAIVILGQQQNPSITCHGDSGGPGMFGTGAAKRVATVTSFGLADACVPDTAGFGRVSKVYDSFIKPFIDGSAGTLSCDECYNSSAQLGGKCGSQAQACQDNADCTAFIDCANACAANDSACFTKCQQDHASGATTYFAISDCVCTTGCPSECGSEAFCQAPACGFSVSPDGAPNCNTCVEAKCCDVDKACFDDPACSACATGQDTSAACDTNAKLKAFTSCINTTCGADCGGSACGFTTNFDGYPECDACVQATCCGVDKACFDDPACSACATGQDTSAACDTNAKLKAFTDCIYGDTCGVKCGAAKCGFTAQDQTCQTCFEGSCCTEFSACSKDSVCTNCLGGKTTGAECDGNKTYQDAITCLSGKCSSECGGGSGGSGAGGNGAGGSIGAAGSGTAGSGTAGSGTAGSGTAGTDTGTGGNGTAGSGTAGSGTAGSGTAGSGTAGSGTAGSGTAGTDTGAGGNGTAGTATSAGGSSSGGNPGSTNQGTGSSSDDSGGCGCQVPGNSSTPAPGAALAALSALGMMISRRRRR